MPETTPHSPDDEFTKRVEYSPDFPKGIEDAVIIDDPSPEDASGKDESTEVLPASADTPEVAKSPEATEAQAVLLRTHALRQTAVESVANVIGSVESIAHGFQNMRSAIKTRSLRAEQTRAQKRYERHAHKAESSMFAFRRRKFERKASVSRKTLATATKSVRAQEQFVKNRQEKRDQTTAERWKQIEKQREILTNKSRFARERRQRRRDLIEMKLTLVSSRAEELREKRKNQLPMVELRKAIFASAYANA